jgi:hypothetical protein
MSAIRSIQARIASLILADTARFAAAPSAADLVDGAEPAAGLCNVILDLPGDIQTGIDRALAATGIVVIVWTPSYTLPEGELGRHRKFLTRVWVVENVTLNRAAVGALAAEDLLEAIDAAVSERGNGLTPFAKRSLGTFRIEGEILPIGGEDAEFNQFQITFATVAPLAP